MEDGTEFEGDFVRGFAEGDVEIRFPSGASYSGKLTVRLSCDMNQMNCSKNSVYQGDGILSNSSGDRFEGQFKDGQRHGIGVLVTASGMRLEGEWKEDQRWNLVAYDPDGSQRGRYEDGVWKSP